MFLPDTTQSLLILSWARMWLHGSSSYSESSKELKVRPSILHFGTKTLGRAVVVVGMGLPIGSGNYQKESIRQLDRSFDL